MNQNVTIEELAHCAKLTVRMVAACAVLLAVLPADARTQRSHQAIAEFKRQQP